MSPCNADCNVLTLDCPAAGLCKSDTWSCGPHMQLCLAGWEYRILPVNVPAWVLHISLGHSSYCDSVGNKYNSKVDSCLSSIGMELLGLCPICSRVSLTCQESLGCVPLVALVHVYCMVSFDQIAARLMQCTQHDMVSCWVTLSDSVVSWKECFVLTFEALKDICAVVSI